MLVDRTDRLERLRRTYSNYSEKSKGPYRRMLVTGHGLKMLETLKKFNPKIPYEELINHALSVALDDMPMVASDEHDEGTLRRVKDILAMHGHTLESWSVYHGFHECNVLKRLHRIDTQFNLFKCGKAEEAKNSAYTGRPLHDSPIDIAFRNDFGLEITRLVSNDIIIYE